MKTMLSTSELAKTQSSATKDKRESDAPAALGQRDQRFLQCVAIAARRKRLVPNWKMGVTISLVNDRSLSAREG
ncbi:hypothetical protein NKJ88_30885 [Mesorhizobium sp. M0016]|uniref:hypothetical protein n=1 Tax=Mesorhizobium sp. M0016 TaxID=2956843 RepID=UPI00333B6F4E